MNFAKAFQPACKLIAEKRSKNQFFFKRLSQMFQTHWRDTRDPRVGSLYLKRRPIYTDIDNCFFLNYLIYLTSGHPGAQKKLQLHKDKLEQLFMQTENMEYLQKIIMSILYHNRFCKYNEFFKFQIDITEISEQKIVNYIPKN